MAYALEAMNGPLDGKRWELAPAVVIGRDASVAQAIIATDSAVSRRHAQVSLEHGVLTIADLGSRNGTLVDGVPIAQPVALMRGQTFVVGRTMLGVIDAGRDDGAAEDL
ncbi:MAG: FHA domain-containing protein [Candidatus Eremiobacteraeota bacterium]|nr:FHA domain-containing protein [Candidatus Eremiobacteraeota bacterium]MBC5828549.1 FHA domain-containing protein [Candidatus Eremiobacteraeota bacterium]